MAGVMIAESDGEKLRAWEVVENVYPDIASRIPNHLAYKEKILSKAKILFVENNQNVIGMAAFYCNDFRSKTAYITQIAVIKSFQSKGNGGLLLSECERISIESGMCYLRLEVRKENQGALFFYKKHGFTFEKDSQKNKCYLIKVL